MSYLNVVNPTDVVKAGTMVAETVAKISDMNKRRRFEESLALLSNKQQQELNEKMLKASTDSERLSILSSAIVQYAIANENAAASKDTVVYIVAGGLAAVVLAGSIFYAVKTK